MTLFLVSAILALLVMVLLFSYWQNRDHTAIRIRVKKDGRVIQLELPGEWDVDHISRLIREAGDGGRDSEQERSFRRSGGVWLRSVLAGNRLSGELPPRPRPKPGTRA